MVRVKKKTVLIYGEGAHDCAFLTHLKNTYNKRDSPIAVQIKRGRGGSPLMVVAGALKVPGDYDTRVVKLDHDTSAAQLEEAITFAEEHSVEIIFSTPCLEHLLLDIVGDTRLTKIRRSSTLKSTFESSYLNSAQRKEPKKYINHFSQSVLEEARHRIPELDRLITLMT